LRQRKGELGDVAARSVATVHPATQPWHFRPLQIVFQPFLAGFRAFEIPRRDHASKLLLIKFNIL
jgi:hypothetical protein